MFEIKITWTLQTSPSVYKFVMLVMLFLRLTLILVLEYVDFANMRILVSKNTTTYYGKRLQFLADLERSNGYRESVKKHQNIEMWQLLVAPTHLIFMRS